MSDYRHHHTNTDTNQSSSTDEPVSNQSSLFGLPNTTNSSSSGVPSFTMDQLMQQQGNQNSNNDYNWDPSLFQPTPFADLVQEQQQPSSSSSSQVSATITHPHHQQYLLGQDVTPFGRAPTSTQPAATNSQHTKLDASSYDHALQEATMWRQFWDESNNNNNNNNNNNTTHSTATNNSSSFPNSMEQPSMQPPTMSNNTLRNINKRPFNDEDSQQQVQPNMEMDAASVHRNNSSSSPTVSASLPCSTKSGSMYNPVNWKISNNNSCANPIQEEQQQVLLSNQSFVTKQPPQQAWQNTVSTSSQPISNHNNNNNMKNEPSIAVDQLYQLFQNAQQQQQKEQQLREQPQPVLSSQNQQLPYPTLQQQQHLSMTQLQKLYQQQQQSHQSRLATQRKASSSKQKQQTASSTAKNTVTPDTPTPFDITAQTNSLPSIFMPPSVLMSVLYSDDIAAVTTPQTEVVDTKSTTQQQQHSRSKKQRTSKSFREESPQHCLDRLILQRRGYSPGQLRIKADAAAYDTTPTPLQLASFGTEFVRAVHKGDTETISDMLSCGLSPNPCNQFRDSVVDLICKRGNARVFATLVEHGCELRVCDGFGRTPLHHCCWASSCCPEIAMTILQKDWRQLFLEDKRGQTALEYVREDNYHEWIEFLDKHLDLVVPPREQLTVITSMKEVREEGILSNPSNALPPRLAAAVSSGKIPPAQVHEMTPEMKAKFEY